MGKLTSEEWVQLINTLQVTTPTEGYNPEDLRRWWGKIGEALWAQAAENVPSKAILLMLYRVVEDLSYGVIPQPIRDVKIKGRSGPTYSERQHIRHAVTYHHAVTNKLVDGLVDPHPTKTIRDAFGLSTTRTVQKWIKLYDPFQDLRHLERKMRGAGMDYQVANARTHRAIRQKAKRGERK